jgi:hypothetical protein
METFIATDEDITALIDKVFDESPFPGFKRMKIEAKDMVTFTTTSHIGVGRIFFELRTIAKLILQEYPPKLFPGFAFVALVEFLNRLQVAMSLAVDNANDMSLIDVREALDAARSVMPHLPSPTADDGIDQLRETLMKRIAGRNRVLTHRPYPTPHADVSIPRLMAALAMERKERASDQITIASLANRLECSDSAVYKALSRHGIDLEEFLNSPALDWKPKGLDKLDRFLSKIK